MSFVQNALLLDNRVFSPLTYVCFRLLFECARRSTRLDGPCISILEDNRLSEPPLLVVEFFIELIPIGLLKKQKKNRLELCKPIDSNTFNSYCADDDAIERVCGKTD